MQTLRWLLLLLLLVLSSYGCAHTGIVDPGYIVDNEKSEPLLQDDWPDYREDRDAQADSLELFHNYLMELGYRADEGRMDAQRIMDEDFAKASAKSGR